MNNGAATGRSSWISGEPSACSGRVDRAGSPATVVGRLLGRSGALRFSSRMAAAWLCTSTSIRATLTSGRFGPGDLQGVAFDEQGGLWFAGNVHGGQIREWNPGDRHSEPVRLEAPPCSAATPFAAVVIESTRNGHVKRVGIIPGGFFATSIGVRGNDLYLAGYHYPAHDVPDVLPSPRRRGARHAEYPARPAVLRYHRDTFALRSYRIFEGAQTVWHLGENLEEFHWQPTEVEFLPDGDLIVTADGGMSPSYFYAPDRLIRVSPDLQDIRWQREVAHPRVQPVEKVSRYWPEFHPWSFEAFGQTRILRMRVNTAGRIAIAGWSPSKTSREPWWCPLLMVWDAEGRPLWQAYAVDPMSGGGDRLDGLVADSAVVSVAWGLDGSLWLSGVSDGGNTIMARDPRDWRRPAPTLRGEGPAARRGRCLFYGLVARLDENGLLRDGLRLTHSETPVPGSAPNWVVDLAALPDGGVVVAGRRGWSRPPAAYLQRFDPALRAVWTLSLPHVEPFRLTARGWQIAVVGIAFGRDSESATASPVTDPDSEHGWWMALEIDP